MNIWVGGPMQTSLFSFDLPEHLIARTPSARREGARLMLMDRRGGGVEHHRVVNLVDLVAPGTVMVFNDTRVRKARMFAHNAHTGGRGEFLFVSPLGEGDWDCIVDRARKKRMGQEWLFPDGARGQIVGEPAPDRRTVRFEVPPDEAWFEAHGHVPLPPYMGRIDTTEDQARYQTVYAREVGSAAAPTAGLHFTLPLLDELKSRNVELHWITLRVGLGTFAPVRSESLLNHEMHTETYTIPRNTCQAVSRAHSEGRPVLAVGTTSVRTLEAAWNGREVEEGDGATNLFIYPGYTFEVVNQLITNFHTPRSSLLMLVSAFCGRENLLETYRTAVAEEYRFFSYGDAMFIR